MTAKIIFKLLSTVIFLICMPGCKKSVDPSDGHYIRFTQNGEKIEYKYPSGQTDGPSGGFHWLEIGAEGEKEFEQFGISVMDAEPISIGKQYVSDANGDLVVLGMSDSNDTYWGSNIYDNPNVVVEITEMTKTNIKGKFSGKLFTENNEAQVLQIGDGEFSVLRVGKTE